MFKRLQARSIFIGDDADAFTISTGNNTKIATGKSLSLNALDPAAVIKLDQFANRLKRVVR